MKYPKALVAIYWIVLGCLAHCSNSQADPRSFRWEGHLRADAIVLLGEIHDNAEQHRLRLGVLRRALAAGWRPAIAMEQFDREHQQDMDQARRERPLDADYLIQKAATTQGRAPSGWDWSFYRPYVALALQYDLPLLAADLSATDAGRVFAQGYASVFDTNTVATLGLDAIPESRIEAQQREVEIGHCHAMPEDQLPAMARAQLARDAVMASVLREHASAGVVLLAGDGHVRRDIGVASWLPPDLLSRVFAVGFTERGDSSPRPDAFDAVVITAAARRADPCVKFRQSLHSR
jgi:uncharacterized iron-regulated protein